MKDVGGKPESFRTARAQATLRMPSHCVELLRSGETEKGDPLATSRVAGILAAKRTDEILPLCHPLPLQRAEVTFALGDGEVVVTAVAETIAPTGVEMEALTAATVSALCLYDMLKPYADQSELALIDAHLVEKTGGKSHFPRRLAAPVGAAVLAVAGEPAQASAEAVVDALGAAGFEPVTRHIVGNAGGELHDAIAAERDNGTALIVTVGGTGLGHTDIAVDTAQHFITTELPGLIETARVFGQRRDPGAMLVRGVAGLAHDSVLITLSGGRARADEALAALMPGLIGLLGLRGGSAVQG